MSIGRRVSRKMNALRDIVGPDASGPSRLIGVMAKEPEPGKVKTRLCPPLSPSLAARCHEAFVTDTLTRLAAVGTEDTELELAVAPAGAAPRLQKLAAEAGWRCVAQEGPDLGARMRARLVAAVARGATAIVLGADSPDLPLARIEEAFEALRTFPVVLGPAEDGGYYLIGCRARVPDIFGPGVTWGGASVLSDTLARIANSGSEAALLEPWPDVDDWPGLLALAGRLRAGTGGPGETTPRSTIKFLAELDRLGMAV
jgi:rSAM/selenodomain-associated transferase 1